MYWRRNYVATQHIVPSNDFADSLSDVVPAMQRLKPGEHPFGDMHVQTSLSILIEPHMYLRAALLRVYALTPLAL